MAVLGDRFNPCDRRGLFDAERGHQVRFPAGDEFSDVRTPEKGGE
jgi:hypothetical protein